jgi:hypothetical protein
MPTTYVNIATTTLGSTQSTVTFSSISSTYTDLVLRISARDNQGQTAAPITLTINGTSTNYSMTNMGSSGASVFSNRQSNASSISLENAANSSLATASTFSNLEIYIPNYTVSVNKQFSAVSGTEQNSTTGWQTATAGLWGNTATISSITLTSGGSFVSGSSFYLYGIKNS